MHLIAVKLLKNNYKLSKKYKLYINHKHSFKNWIIVVTLVNIKYNLMIVLVKISVVFVV